MVLGFSTFRELTGGALPIFDSTFTALIEAPDSSTFSLFPPIDYLEHIEEGLNVGQKGKWLICITTSLIKLA